MIKQKKKVNTLKQTFNKITFLSKKELFQKFYMVSFGLAILLGLILLGNYVGSALLNIVLKK
jgi:hypothetical protein